MTEFPIPGELLREHVRALAALANRLVHDRQAAEDAVQDTLVAALTSAAPRRGALWAWLTTILKNRVRQDARANLRRRAREARLSAPPDSPAASEVSSELQLHRRLVDLVHDLDASSRQVLFLRFWRGLSPSEIATLLAVSDKAVHSRIERALARLRASLDDDYEPDGGRAAWTAVLCASGPGRHFALDATALGVLMKTKTMLGVAVAIAVFAALPFLEFGAGRGRAPQAGSPGPDVAAASLSTGADATTTTTTSAREIVAEPGSATPVAAQAATVIGFVRDLGGQPIAGVEVLFERMNGERTFRRDPDVPAVTSAADGSFVMVWPGHVGWVTVRDVAWAAVRRPWCEHELPSQPPVVIVAPARRFAGTVVDPTGVPVAEARITAVLSDEIAPARAAGAAVVALPNDLATASSDMQGHFVLTGVGWISGMRLVAECAPFGAASIELPATSTEDLLLQLASPSEDPRVYGLLLDARGGPVAGAYVAVGGDSVRSATDGRFSVPWHGKRRPAWVRAVQPRVGIVTERLLPDPWQPGWQFERPITLQLPPSPGEVRGRVLDAAGAPMGGVRVWTPDLTWFGNVLVDHNGHQVSSPSSAEGMANDPNAGMDAVMEIGTTSDAEGRFVLHGLVDRDYALFAMAPTTLAAIGPLQARPGVDVELRLAAPSLRRVTGQLVAAVGGEPLAGVRVAVGRDLAWQRPQRAEDPWSGSVMMPAGAGHLFREVTVRTDADGRFVLPPLETAGAYLWFDSEALFLAPRFQLSTDRPQEDLHIALPPRSTFHLSLEQPGEADKFSIEAVDGSQQPLFVRVEGAVISIGRVDLVNGRGPEAYTRAGDVVVVLSKGGVEVRRATVTLRPGEHDVRL